jgi:hypothetical protein
MPSLDRINKAYKGRIREATKQITHADLTAAATTQTIDFDAALPADAFVIGVYAEVTTAMSGGAVSACTADLGVKSGDTDGFMDAVDIFTGAAEKASVPRGVAVPGHHGGTTPSIVVDSTGANVSVLTAGDVTFHVLFLSDAAPTS